VDFFVKKKFCNRSHCAVSYTCKTVYNARLAGPFNFADMPQTLEIVLQPGGVMKSSHAAWRNRETPIKKEKNQLIVFHPSINVTKTNLVVVDTSVK